MSPVAAGAGCLVHHTPGAERVACVGAAAVVAGAIQLPVCVALTAGEGRHRRTEAGQFFAVHGRRSCETRGKHRQQPIAGGSLAALQSQCHTTDHLASTSWSGELRARSECGTLTACAALWLILAPSPCVGTTRVDALPPDVNGLVRGVLVAPQLRTLAATLRLVCWLKRAVQRLDTPTQASDGQHGGKVLCSSRQTSVCAGEASTRPNTPQRPAARVGAQLPITPLAQPGCPPPLLRHPNAHQTLTKM